jgi:DNA-binding response OmpR family regulator
MSRPDLKATIMIVDDEPENLSVLHEILQSGKHRVVAFPRGELALEAAVAHPPDVVLLDVRMPGMNGYEVCSQFKSNTRLRDIPILFLSALTGSKEKIEAFKAGAVDYLQKPVNEVEVLARVETHLQLRRYATGLEMLVQERTSALAEANRRLKILNDAKTDWLNMLSHELRTPLMGLLGVSEMLFRELPVKSKLRDLKLGYETSRRRLQELIDGADLLTQVTVAPEMFQVSITPLAALLVGSAREVETRTGVACSCALHGEDERIQVLAEPKLLRRAIEDLLHSATCCMGLRGRVTLHVTRSAGLIRLAFWTDGLRMKQAALDTFFEVCGQRDRFATWGDFGLRPALGRRIIRMFGGEVEIRNLEAIGVEIAVTLPVAEERSVHVS